MLKVILVLALVSASASAAENPKYKQFFLLNGKTVSSEEAIMASIRGGEAFKCTAVEAKLSKSGTSIGLRNVKKKTE